MTHKILALVFITTALGCSAPLARMIVTDGGVAPDDAARPAPHDGAMPTDLAPPPTTAPTTGGQCRVSDDCVGAQRCSAAKCEGSTICTSDHDCQSAQLVCDTTGARCVDCNSAGDCAANQACVGHSCIAAQACTSSKQCPSGLLCAEADPPAWPGTVLGMACQQCAADTDCPSGSGCTDGLCYNLCLKNDIHCGTYQGASCGTCGGAAQCLGPNGCDSVFATYPADLPSMDVPESQGIVVGPTTLIIGTAPFGVYSLNLSTKSLTQIDSASVRLPMTSNSTVGVLGRRRAQIGAAGGRRRDHSLCQHRRRDAQPHGHCRPDESFVYGSTNQGIYAFALASNSAPVLLTSDGAQALGARTTARAFYVPSNQQSSVNVVTSAGVVTTLATTTDSPQPTNIVTDDENVYWSTASGIYATPQIGGKIALVLPWANSANSLLQVSDGALYAFVDGSYYQLDLETGLGRVLFAESNYYDPATFDGQTAWQLGQTGIERITILP